MARTKSTKNGDSSTKKLAPVTMISSDVKNSTNSMTMASSSMSSNSMPLEDQIRLRAYEIYQQRGYTPGNEREDWLTAEREVLARSHSKRQSA